MSGALASGARRTHLLYGVALVAMQLALLIGTLLLWTWASSAERPTPYAPPHAAQQFPCATSLNAPAAEHLVCAALNRISKQLHYPVLTLAVLSLLLPLGPVLYLHWRDLSVLNDYVQQLRGNRFNGPPPVIGMRVLNPLAQQLTQLGRALAEQHHIQRVMSHALTHEMGSPLSRLCFGLELLSQRHADASDVIDDLRADIDDLEALTRDAMEYTHFTLMTWVSVESINLHTLLSELNALRPKHGCELIIYPVAQALRLQGHRQALLLALRNLIGNALRHAHGRVEVSTWYSEGRAHLCVDDDGPGIPVQHRQKVFEPYVRLQADANGSGLGLAMVRTIIEKHGGSLAVGEAALGGARMHIHLPACDH